MSTQNESWSDKTNITVAGRSVSWDELSDILLDTLEYDLAEGDSECSPEVRFASLLNQDPAARFIRDRTLEIESEQRPTDIQTLALGLSEWASDLQRVANALDHYGEAEGLSEKENCR